MKRFFGMAASIALLAVSASAQDANADKIKAELKALLDKSRVIGASGGVMGKVVKGAPYSAQELSESTQTLADGTRIRNETKANVYRDSEGRVRRETGDVVTIWDPVASVSYTLDSKSMTAFKASMGAPVFVRHSAAGVGGGFGSAGGTSTATVGPMGVGPSTGTVSVKDGMVTVTQDGHTRTFPMPPNGEWTSEDGKMHAFFKQTENGPGVPAGTASGNVSHTIEREGQVIVTRDGKTTAMPLPPGEIDIVDRVWVNALPNNIAASKMVVRGLDAGKEESLGEQMIEGVKSTGTRRTSTIEIGAIGNDRPINTVTERWYSPDLQTEVMTRHSDPRTGESSFKLTNISRSEPAAYLFQVPSGYTVNERR